MANYYTQFCEHLELKDIDQEVWWADALLPQDHERKPQWARELLRDMHKHIGNDPEEEGVSFTYRIDKKLVKFTADESANPFEVGYYVQAFYKHFDLDDVFSLTYADICSRDLPGAFGGGCVIAAKDELIHESAKSHAELEVESILEGRKVANSG